MTGDGNRDRSSSSQFGLWWPSSLDATMRSLGPTWTQHGLERSQGEVDRLRQSALRWPATDPPRIAPARLPRSGQARQLSLFGGFTLMIADRRATLPMHARRVLAYLSLQKLARSACDH